MSGNRQFDNNNSGILFDESAKKAGKGPDFKGPDWAGPAKVTSEMAGKPVIFEGWFRNKRDNTGRFISFKLSAPKKKSEKIAEGKGLAHPNPSKTPEDKSPDYQGIIFVSKDMVGKSLRVAAWFNDEDKTLDLKVSEDRRPA